MVSAAGGYTDIMPQEVLNMVGSQIDAEYSQQRKEEQIVRPRNTSNITEKDPAAGLNISRHKSKKINAFDILKDFLRGL